MSPLPHTKNLSAVHLAVGCHLSFRIIANIFRSSLLSALLFLFLFLSLSLSFPASFLWSPLSQQSNLSALASPAVFRPVRSGRILAFYRIWAPPWRVRLCSVIPGMLPKFKSLMHHSSFTPLLLTGLTLQLNPLAFQDLWVIVPWDWSVWVQLRKAWRWDPAVETFSYSPTHTFHTHPTQAPKGSKSSKEFIPKFSEGFSPAPFVTYIVYGGSPPLFCDVFAYNFSHAPFVWHNLFLISAPPLLYDIICLWLWHHPFCVM